MFYVDALFNFGLTGIRTPKAQQKFQPKCFKEKCHHVFMMTFFLFKKPVYTTTDLFRFCWCSRT